MVSSTLHFGLRFQRNLNVWSSNWNKQSWLKIFVDIVKESSEITMYTQDVIDHNFYVWNDFDKILSNSSFDWKNVLRKRLSFDLNNSNTWILTLIVISPFCPRVMKIFFLIYYFTFSVQQKSETKFFITRGQKGEITIKVNIHLLESFKSNDNLLLKTVFQSKLECKRTLSKSFQT